MFSYGERKSSLATKVDFLLETEYFSVTGVQLQIIYYISFDIYFSVKTLCLCIMDRNMLFE